MAKHASSDKARRPDEDKLKIRTVTRDQATLERNATLEENAGADNGRRAICFNSACPDYRVERPASQACGCKRKTIDTK